MAVHATCNREMEGFLTGREEFRIKERTVLFFCMLVDHTWNIAFCSGWHQSKVGVQVEQSGIF